MRNSPQKGYWRGLCLLLVAAGPVWRLTFTAHPDNVGVLIVTSCAGRQPFFAYNRADLEGSESSASMRRHVPEPGSTCTVSAAVLRHGPTDDVLDEFVAESAYVTDASP